MRNLTVLLRNAVPLRSTRSMPALVQRTLSLALAFACGLVAERYLTSHPGLASVQLPAAALLAAGSGWTTYRLREQRSPRWTRLKGITRANWDSLTGCMDRHTFLNLGEHSLTEENFGCTGLLVVDVDRFTLLNESVGHHACDRVLRQIVITVKQMIRSSDVLGRLDGDAFGVLLKGGTDGTCRALGDSVRAAIAELSWSGIHDFGPVTVSIGMASCLNEGASMQELLSQAEMAKYLAKNGGRNRCEFYSAESVAAADTNSNLEQDLSRALDLGEIFTVYQPQVDLASGRIVGAEALARWQHPLHGAISPDVFIPLAESSGQILAIGALMLKTACKQRQDLANIGLGQLMMSVNVSAVQLQDPGFADVVLLTLASTGMPAPALILEVTETMRMHAGEQGETALRVLAAKGVRIAIDDFGTGYSSLSYLRMLPCDFLKIDRSFVTDLPHNDHAVSIARAIVSMGRSLGMRIIAEGVETQEQADFLQSIWCDEGQGYLFARPMCARDLEAWIPLSSEGSRMQVNIHE